MLTDKILASVLNQFPDPVFVLSESGKYIGVYGGRDVRYYRDASGLVGNSIGDFFEKQNVEFFLKQIKLALDQKQLVTVEYELMDTELAKLLPDEAPPIAYFEGRINPLDFTVEGERVVIWVASNRTDRHFLQLELKKMCDTDGLTQLYNRRRLDEDMKKAFENFKRLGVNTSLLALDLDNLKQVNDSLGHHEGDNLLKLLAKVCHTSLRMNDSAYRLGGDEFLVAMPLSDFDAAMAFAGRLREHFLLDAEKLQGIARDCSVSVGVSMFKDTDSSFNDALIRADKALYAAKKQGKNSVFSSSEVTGTGD